MKYQNWKRIISNNYVYISTFVISTIVMISAMIISRVVPFGENFPLPGNGFIQDYSQFFDAFNKIKKGIFFDILDYRVGLALDNYDYTVFLILHPWLYLLYCITPDSCNISVFFLYYYFCYAIAGPVFIYYLTHRKFGIAADQKDPKLIVIGLCYGLSAYNINYFIYYFRYMIFIPIIFLGLEKLVYDKKSGLYICTLSYFMATEAYYAFILCIFVVLYFIILEFRTFKAFMLNSIKFIVSSICSAGLAGAFLVPYYFRIRNSPYTDYDGNSSNLKGWFGNIMFPLFDYQAFKKGLMTSSTEYRVNIYCGMLVFLLAFLFLIQNDISKSRRLKTIIYLGIVYIAFDNRFLNYVFHGFHFQWQVPNRFSAFFIFILLIVFYEVISRWELINDRSKLFCLIGTGALLISVYFIVMLNGDISDNNIKDSFLSIILIGLYLFLFFVFHKWKKESVLLVMMMLLALEMVVSSVYTFCSILSFPEGSQEIQYANVMKDFSDRHDDMKQPFVVTERPGNFFNQNISCLAGTYSLSYYTSSSYKQQLDLLYRWGVLFSKNVVYYTNGSPIADMMLHVKYHVTDSNSYESISPYKLIDSEGEIGLYENPYYIPLGVLLDEHSLAQWNQYGGTYLNYNSAAERDNNFASAFGIGNIYDSITLKYFNDNLTNENNYYTFEEYEDGTGLYTFYLNKNVGGKLYLQIAQALEYIGTSEYGVDDVIYYIVPRNINLGKSSDVKLEVLNEENLTQLYSVLSINCMTDHHYNSYSLGGNITSEKP